MQMIVSVEDSRAQIVVTTSFVVDDAFASEVSRADVEDVLAETVRRVRSLG